MLQIKKSCLTLQKMRVLSFRENQEGGIGIGKNFNCNDFDCNLGWLKF